MSTQAHSTVLEVKELVKDYRSTRAVDHLSFQVKRGHVTGLLGPNGAGKTTTFNIICRFLKATSGRVMIGGEELDRFSRVKGRIQALPQDARLPEGTSILRQLAFYGRLQGLPSQTALQEATKVLEQVGLGDKLKTKAGALSHGMHQRAAMAQAFMGKPELILLDEPTNGLDPRHAAEARDLITKLKGETSILVSSHNLAEIQSICDDVIIIDHGKLVYQGSVNDLTGQAAEFKVWVRTSQPVDTATLEALPGIDTVNFNTNESSLRVACVEGTEAAEAISHILRALLDAGHLIEDMKRGSSLEERFLNLTDTNKPSV